MVVFPSLYLQRLQSPVGKTNPLPISGGHLFIWINVDLWVPILFKDCTQGCHQHRGWLFLDHLGNICTPQFASKKTSPTRSIPLCISLFKKFEVHTTLPIPFQPRRVLSNPPHFLFLRPSLNNQKTDCHCFWHILICESVHHLLRETEPLQSLPQPLSHVLRALDH
jgi:hypothetical protein